MVVARLSLKLKNDISELDTLCRSLETFCESLGFSKKCVFEITLVMDELFTNIVSYGFIDKKEHLIKIDVALAEDNLIEIRVEDDGIAFNPIKADEPVLKCPLEERKIGGLGLHLVKKIMNHVIYKRRDKKNVLVLKKSLSKCCQ